MFLTRLVSRAALGAAALLLFAGCGDDTAPLPPIEPTYANVQEMLTNGCAFSSCHGDCTPGGAGAAQLNFAPLLDQGKPLTEALVDVPSCEYYLMPRVDPGNPDNSWLWIKLDPDHDDNQGHIVFTPDPSFDPAGDPYPSSNCPLMVGGELSFGRNMPNTGDVFTAPDNEPSHLKSNQLTALREWIEMGAPGPTGPLPTGFCERDGGTRDAGPLDGSMPDAAMDGAVTDGATADGATADGATTDAG